ncbi:MAG: alpha/beta hydrolase, partial [Acinetobacter sp.]
ASSAKKDFLAMQKLIRPQPIALLTQGLALLEQLNLVEIYKNYQGRQLHVFAEHDALVPYQVERKIKDLVAKNLSVISVEGASHGFPCFMVEQTVQIIEDFLKKTV